MHNRSNLYLIGYMACGKSTVASRLSEIFHVRKLEMDEVIEGRAGMSISEIFEKYGEEKFRDLETDFLKDQIRDNIIVSCGGGTPLREENRKLMKKKGIVIYLSVRPETVVQRLDVHQTGRPLLKGHVDVSYIESMMAKRDPIYRAFADCVIATDHREIDDICRDIISFVQGKA
ncbi:MAG TPA: shikimate kinase [Oribacterium sp.]|nr:shikimate kinase [Oribacterium sp.]